MRGVAQLEGEHRVDIGLFWWFSSLFLVTLSFYNLWIFTLLSFIALKYFCLNFSLSLVLFMYLGFYNLFYAY